MNFPSTHSETLGGNPSLGDVLSNIESSHGVRLTGGSTGGIVEPFGDDANISLTVRAKGTGTLTLGTGTGAVGFGAANKLTVQFTPPAMAASTGVESTYTLAGLTTSHFIIIQPQSPLSPAYTYQPRCSTAAELVVRWGNLFGSTIGTGESTNRFNVLVF